MSLPDDSDRDMPRAGRRILMTADGVGGVWPYALDLASGLTEYGVAVTVAVMGPPLRRDQLADAKRRGLDVREGGHALEWMRDPWEGVGAAGEWLMGLADAVMPDLVHLNGYCHAALPWQVPTLVAGHSCVRSWWRGVHGGSPPPEWETYSGAVARGLRAATVVATPSLAMMRELQAEYGPLQNVRTIPNGSRAVDTMPRVAPAKRDIVLSAGRVWDEAKNIEALHAAAPALPWPVYVAGDASGPGGGGAPLSNAVHHLGALAPEVLRDWYDKAAIYALPARYEPFGLSVLEAAAAGCALVLGDIASLRENWSDAAVFVHPDDHAGLARAIRALIDAPQRRRRLAEAARARARQFSVERMVDGYLRAYTRAGALHASAIFHLTSP
jgi:glycogen(starch) synthase